MKFPRELGYTIVEVMIFLAITGLIFVGAAVAVGGQQRNVQYSQSVRDFESQIKDVINDVSNGYFPDTSRGACSVASGKPSFSDTSNDKGTSVECVFVGKSIFFNVSGQDDSFGVGTLVGANTNIGSQVTLTISDLKPALAYEPGKIDLTEYKSLRYGLKVTKIAQMDDSAVTYDSINFIAGLNSAQSNSKNGTLTTNVYLTEGAVLAQPQAINYFANLVDGLDSTSPVNVPGGIFVCVKAPDGRNARIIIGDGGVNTSTSSEFDLASGVCP